jgi:tetraacyldisaccharide 4'-kinase
MHLLEMLYYSGFAAKRFYSLRNRRRLPFRVISIGNLTAGGTGKTPAAIAVAGEAGRRGYKPVILTRGYRGKAKGPCFVTKGEGPLLTVLEGGDEPLLMAEKTEGVPIVKGGDRYESGMFALRELGMPGEREYTTPDSHSGPPFLFILDDGFQHFSLFRDKDIVLVDAANPFGNGLLLPLGRLREPAKALGRADIIVLTKLANAPGDKGRRREDLIGAIRKHNPDAPVFLARHVPAYLGLVSGEKLPFSLVAGKRLFGFCALGSPDSFRATIQSLDAELSGFKAFRDHYRYTRADMAFIESAAEKSGAEWIVTTEKDIIKLRNLDLPGNILIIGVEFSVEGNFYDEAFRT